MPSASHRLHEAEIFPLGVHTSGARPNGHDFLLHRRHSSTAWPQRQLKLRLSAMVVPAWNRTLVGDAANSATDAALRHRSPILFLVHGFAHSPEDYELHASVLQISRRSWLLRSMDACLISNSISNSTPALLSALRRYPAAMRMLMHTDLDVGHQCSEFMLLAASAWLWSRYEWVVYCSGPDEYVTPSVSARLSTLIRAHRESSVPELPPAIFADPFPGALAGGKNVGPLVVQRGHFMVIQRYSLDLMLFRPAAVVAPHAVSVWWNATAVCTAQRAYHGLPETVLQWVSVSFNLSVRPISSGVLDTGAKLKQCKVTDEHVAAACSRGRAPAGVWHTHNASAVREWLALRSHES